MKQTIVYMILLGSLLGMTACSSNGKRDYNADIDLTEDQILSSSDGSKFYPSWAYDEPRYIRQGEIFVSAGVDINADQSPSRGLEAASILARANLSAELRERLQSQTQFASEGLDVDRQSLNHIVNRGSEIERLHGIHVVKQWYAKVKVPSEQGLRARYRCFTLVAMPLELYKMQLARVMKGESSKPFTPEFEKRMNESWDRYFGEAKVESVTQIKAVGE